MRNIAHVKKDTDGHCIEHLLVDHLNNTGKRAQEYASEFNSSDWAELLGYWHDLGKFHPVCTAIGVVL